MATITFTPDNGGDPQVFDLGVLQTLTPAPTITEVKVEESDGTEVVAEPQA